MTISPADAEAPPRLAAGCSFMCCKRHAFVFSTSIGSTNFSVCVACAASRWLKHTVFALPSFLLVLAAFWAINELLLPVQWRFDLTAPRVLTPRILVLMLLTCPVIWHEWVIPRVNARRERREDRRREQRLEKGIKEARLRKEATRRCRNCMTAYRDQSPSSGRFTCAGCGHVSRRPVLDLLDTSRPDSVRDQSHQQSCVAESSPRRQQQEQQEKQQEKKQQQEQQKEQQHFSLPPTEEEISSSSSDRGNVGGSIHNTSAHETSSIQGTLGNADRTLENADDRSARSRHWLRNIVFPAVFLPIAAVWRAILQAMALFFSAAGWFRRRFVGPRTAEAGVRRGSPSASAEACADRAARARRKMIGMRKLTRAEREATEAEERKQREEIAQMVDAQRKAREQAEGASTNNWEVVGKKPATVGKAVEVPSITRRAVTNKENCPYKGSRSQSVVSAKSLTGETKSLGQPISSARRAEAPMRSAQAGVLGKGQVRSGLPASCDDKGFEAPEKSAAAFENKGSSSSSSSGSSSSSSSGSSSSVWNKGSTSGSTTGGGSSSSVGGGGGGGARNKGTILCPAPPPRSSNEYTPSPIQASPPTRDNRTFSQVAKSSSRRSSGEHDKQGGVTTGGKEGGPSIVRLGDWTGKEWPQWDSGIGTCSSGSSSSSFSGGRSSFGSVSGGSSSSSSSSRDSSGSGARFPESVTASEPSTGTGESEVTGTALWSYPAIAPLLHPAPAAAPDAAAPAPAAAATSVSPPRLACDPLPSTSSFPSSSFTTPIKQHQQQQQQRGGQEAEACGREWQMWGSSLRLSDALAATPPTFAAASSAALPSSSPLPASALSSSPVPSSSAASLTTTLTTTTTPHSYLANPFALPFSSPFSLGFSPTLVPATPVDPAPLTNSPLNLSTPAAPLPSTAVGTVERSGFTGSKNNFNAARHAFPGSWSAGGVASESSQQSPRFPGSWSAGGQDLTGFGDALKSNAFRAAIGGGRGGVGGGASGGGMRAAWMAEMWDEDVPPAFVDCITQEIMRDPVITADGHSYERAAIEKWLMHHDTSPMTGKVLPPLHATAATAATSAAAPTALATAATAEPFQGGCFTSCLAGCSCKHRGQCMGQGRCSAVGSGGEGCSEHCVVDKTLRPNHILRGQIIEFQELMALQARERTAAAPPTRAAAAFTT